MNKQQKRNKVVLERLLAMNEDKGWATTIADTLEVGCNKVQGNDEFGTESQSDPRGDGRDDVYSMYNNVSGVD